MAMDVVDYEIFGNEMQYVEVELDPGEAAVGEAGAMMYMQAGIEMDTVFGDGSQQGGLFGKLMGAGKRLLTGETLFTTVFQNTATSKQRVAFAAPYPGKIVPIDLSALGGTLLCQKDSFLCAAKGVSLGIAFQQKLGVGLFGGEGFIMQKISGQGIVFIHASGTLKEVVLTPDDELKIDTGCLVGMSSTVRYDIKYTGKLKNSLFGGEGLFYATVSGPGKVWIQSLPMNRLSKVLMSAALTGSSSRSSWMGKFYLLAVILVTIATVYSKP